MADVMSILQTVGDAAAAAGSGLGKNLGTFVDTVRSSPYESYTDNSTGAINYDAPGNTYRGIGADWFNADNIAKEDFLRNEIAKDNDLIRNRSFRQTAYQDTVADLKKAGLNPALAYQNAATTATSSSPGSSGAGSYKADSSKLSGLLFGIAKMVAGAFLNNPSAVVSGFTDIKTSWRDGHNMNYMTSRTYDFKK